MPAKVATTLSQAPTQVTCCCGGYTTTCSSTPAATHPYTYVCLPHALSLSLSDLRCKEPQFLSVGPVTSYPPSPVSVRPAKRRRSVHPSSVLLSRKLIGCRTAICGVPYTGNVRRRTASHCRYAHVCLHSNDITVTYQHTTRYRRCLGTGITALDDSFSRAVCFDLQSGVAMAMCTTIWAWWTCASFARCCRMTS